ncbi:GNAT family N-acetyltransferase [Piscirickettsia litoralis]|uniref:N-acetyltransferase domain-containing protein n=1 Tax=Piscirickettsia litoralis TaxID=1891921 RepID=A0ABX3A1F9_9GAMM|nr:GNAT family N-acetyltransferase [Piscirickettsia litoralis]ODN42706.1 hypothetical protein BGC07_06935 [Piscirickettsia litoralis]
MHDKLRFRKAKRSDLAAIVTLLIEDDLGQARERAVFDDDSQLDERYLKAFNRIDMDKNQHLVVGEIAGAVVATCHLTLLPSLSFIGSTRMQIEAVRVAESVRGQQLGKSMMEFAIDWGQVQGATIIQLTTNKLRPRAKQFYDSLGFEATHDGMKLYL